MRKALSDILSGLTVVIATKSCQLTQVSRRKERSQLTLVTYFYEKDRGGSGWLYLRFHLINQKIIDPYDPNDHLSDSYRQTSNAVYTDSQTKNKEITDLMQYQSLISYSL